MMDAQQMFDGIADRLAEEPRVARAKMFGKQCVTVNGNGFLALFDDAMVFKLRGEAHRRGLALEGAKLWDPSGGGRPMKEWVQIPAIHADRWEELAGASRDYVATLPSK